MTIRLAGPGDVADMARLHAAAFDHPWNDAAVAELLTGAGVFGLMADQGFILCRTVAGEAEILTLAVLPIARRSGVGRALVEAAVQAARQDGADSLFLEVATDNRAALALYAAAGFAEVGRRRGYYPRPGGAVDAVVMRRDLNT